MLTLPIPIRITRGSVTYVNFVQPTELMNQITLKMIENQNESCFGAQKVETNLSLVPLQQY